MKVELHLHSKRYSACAGAIPEDLMRRLIEFGYQAVFITEHDDVWSNWELADLRLAFPEIRIFPGVEISLGAERREHLLVLGTNDRSYLRMATAQDIIRRAREEDLPTVLSHPYRWDDSPPALAGKTLPDAIERLTCNHDATGAAKSDTFAQRHKVALVNSGDVHAQVMVNRYWIETLRAFETPQELRNLLRHGLFTNHEGPGIGAGA